MNKVVDVVVVQYYNSYIDTQTHTRRYTMSNSNVYYNVVQTVPTQQINMFKTVSDANEYIVFLDGYWTSKHDAKVVELTYPSDYQMESIDRFGFVLTVFVDDTSVEYSIDIDKDGYISETASVVVLDEDLNVIETKTVETPQWIFDIVAPDVYAELD